VASRFALGFAFFIVASCMPKHSETTSQVAGEASNNGTLIQCKKTLNENGQWDKKGSMEVFLISAVSRRIVAESDKSLGAPIGFSGKSNNGDGLSDSQGGQPVVASVTKIGKRMGFEFAEKVCAGQCGNHIYIADGAGDGEMTSFLNAKSMSFDTNERELTIVGTLFKFENFGQKPVGKESEMRFSDCDFSDSVFKKMQKEFKK
jgi:hypothetical protein